MARVEPEIIPTDNGFAVRRPNEEVSVALADVCAIRAEKIDLFTSDEIRVTFETKKGPAFEVSEESSGFRDLMDRVLIRFAGADQQWYEKVMRPPFTASRTLIWTEGEQNQSLDTNALHRQ